MKKAIFFIVVCFVCLGGVVILFRVPLLKATGNFLIYENEYSEVDYAFVLSGGAFDRGNKALDLWKGGKINYIVCTGKNQPPDFKAIDLDIMESELTAEYIHSGGVSVNHWEILPEGTSTQEESDAILRYCLTYNIDSIVVISSLFHTRRIHYVFSKKFREYNITVFIDGAPSSSYSEDQWWRNEYGLLAVNNEYVKLIYYWLTY